MNEDNNWLKIQILRKYLEGFSQEQIATELDISEGKVSEYLQESRQQDDTLIFQHEIAVVCNKYNIPIRQLASNLAFSNALKRTAFDQNKINVLLRVLNKILVEDGSFSPEKIATSILQICSFMEANESSFEEIHLKTEEKKQELAEIKMDIAESKKIIARLEKEMTEALRKSRIRLAELRTSNIFKKAFKNAGIDINNLKEITNTISKLDCNPDLIINEMKKTSQLESRKEMLEQKCDEAIKNLKVYENEERIRASYHNTRIRAVDLVNKIIEKGISEDQIVSLVDAIIKHGSYLSLPQLIMKINTYGGFESAIFEAKRELEQLKSEKHDLIYHSEALEFK
jgi:transcriptional regulator with XRE-family HTH domain